MHRAFLITFLATMVTWTSTAHPGELIQNDEENTCGNPCPVIDERTGHIHLPMTWNLGTDHGQALHAGTGQGTRRPNYCRSEDDGQTWTRPVDITLQVKDKHLGDPVCRASFIRYDQQPVLFSTPSPEVSPQRGKRVRMTLRLSRDEGKTWLDSLLVNEGPSAYCCLTRLRSGEIGLLYEAGKSITMSIVPLSVLENERQSAALARPNVVLILIDDLGWKDLGCYGSVYYRTPNIDRLADQGMRFTDGYAACNVCSPTRAAIMTGKYPARLLLTQWLPSGRWSRTSNRLKEARYISNLPLEEVTIAEALRESGYRTAFIGKWHLGTEPYYYPEHQGFDVNIAGRDYGAPGSYFFPFEGSWRIPTTGRTLHKKSPLSGKPGDYLVDRLAEEAESFILDNADKPFFLMLSHYAVHTPLQGKPNKAARYEQIADEERQGKPAYAAMVESVDDSVGRVMKTLRQRGLDQRTLVIFTSDNGGFAGATDNGPLRANKGSNYEGGIRVPVIVKWPGQTKPGSVSHEPVTSTDFYPTILAATGHELRPHQHIDGKNLVPILRGTGGIDRDAIYWHYPHYNRHPQSFPSGVIRAGDWKLIESFETGQLSLYNLADDIGETNDLAGSQPALVAGLHAKLEAWRRDVTADPMKPNPEYVGSGK